MASAGRLSVDEGRAEVRGAPHVPTSSPRLRAEGQLDAHAGCVRTHTPRTFHRWSTVTRGTWVEAAA